MLNYLKLFRFPLVFTSIADSATGYLLIWSMTHEAGTPAEPIPLMLLGLASAGLYCFGMAMNDIADLKRDRQIAPTRVLPSGMISLRSALAASVVVLVLSGVSVAAIPTGGVLWRLGVWGGIVLLILAYDLRALKIPPTMGAIRGLNVILGGVTAWGGDGFPVDSMLLLGIPALVYVSGVTFVSILEDRKVQLPLLAIGGLWIVAGAFTPEIIRWSLKLAVNPAAWVVSLVLAGWIGYRAVTAKDRAGIMLIVRDGVLGVIVLDATMLIAAGLIDQGTGIGFLVVLSFFCMLLFRKFA